MKSSRALVSSAPLAALLCFAATTLAQKSAPPPARPDYSRESSIVEHYDRVYRFAADGTGSREISGVIDVRDQASVKAWSVLNFPFASSAEHVEIDYVRVRRPDGTILPTPATDAQELPAAVTREAPFYSDLKEEQIPVRSLSPGDHLEYRFRVIRTRPEAPNQFWGEENVYTVSNGLVVQSETVELHIPKDKYANVWSPKQKPTTSDSPTEHIYRWESSQLEPVAGKSHNDLLRMEKDPALLDDSEPHLPRIAWTTFHSWPEVGAWYRSLEGSRTDPDDDIRARVKQLLTDKSTDEEKTRAIYGYVGPQIRYIGVAFGIGRYQPHQASEVLSNQYGDCKDKTTLLISMLAAANIPADAVLIGAGVAFNNDVPSPGSFNHAINLAHVNGKPVWLDATAEVAPYQLLSPQIRNHQALVIPLSGEAHIETTPKDPPFPSIDSFTAIGTLDDKGTSHSRIVLDLRGDSEVVFRSTVRSVSPAQWDELMQRISQSMGYAGKVTNTQFSRPDITADPFHATYDYEREKNGDWDTLRIVPQLAPVGLGDVDEKDLPVSPIQLGDPHVDISHAEMKLPTNWSAELPAAIHTKTSFATFDKTYKLENGVLTTDRRFEILLKEVPAADWKIYHQWYKDSGLDGETYVQLVKTSADGSTGHASINPSNPAAEQLVREAMTAGQAKDTATAKSKLDEAKKLNPHQVGLWAGYAMLAFARRDLKDVAANLHHEIAEHPENRAVYAGLAQVELQLNKPQDAIATLQSEADRDPSDTNNILTLGSLLMQRGDYPHAETVFRAGLLASPDNVTLKMDLGIALLHQPNKKDEGEPLLRDVVSTSEDPLQLNNAAYELSLAGLDLPLAEKATRHAIDLLETASNNGETGRPALIRANLITDVWDTLGWIIYRQGKLPEAEPWVRAAWRNGNHAETGYHLGVILSDEHRPAEALAQLELAAVGSNASAEVKKLIETKTSELKKSGAPEPSNDSRVELQRQRTYDFPRGKFTSAADGWATIELDVSTRGTTAARFVQGDQALEPLFDTIRTLNLNLDLPSGSHVSLLRRAVLSCHTATTCQLVLITPSDALNPL